MQINHITITGRLGSGKSTVAHMITEQYGFRYYSTGNIMRQLAEEVGLSICDYNKMIVNDPTEDKKIDDRTREVAIENQDVRMVFDSRMAWFFDPVSFKVYVTVDPGEAARRVHIDPRPGEPNSEVEIYLELEERSKVEQARFIKFYGKEADYFNWKNFNLVVDSTNRTPEEVTRVIWEAYQAYCQDPVANAYIEVL